MSTLRKYLDIITESQKLTEGKKNLVRLSGKYLRPDPDGVPYPQVKGVGNDWQCIDWDSMNALGINIVADLVAPLGLKVYVITDTGADDFWMAVAK